jgi:MFS family permease
MGAVLIASNLPLVPFSLIGGVVTDRFPRARVLLVCDLVRGVAVGLVALGAARHALALWQLVALSVVFGTAETFSFPAYGAAIPDLLPATALPSANALRSLSVRMAGIAGPALGAGIVAAGGTPLAFALDALSFLVSAACLVAVARLPALRARAPRTTGTRADLREGIGTVLGTPVLWIAIGIAGITGITLVGPLEAVLPLLVQQHFRAGVGGYALLQSLEAAGAIVAAVALGHARRLRRRGPLAYGGWLLECAFAITLGLPVPFAAAGLAAALAGAGTATLGLAWTNTLQELVPPERLGRVLSVDALGSNSLAFVGYGLAGLAADRLGAAQVFVLGGAVSAALIALGLLHPAVRKLD